MYMYRYIFIYVFIYLLIELLIYFNIYISAGHLDASGSMSLPIGAYVSV